MFKDFRGLKTGVQTFHHQTFNHPTLNHDRVRVKDETLNHVRVIDSSPLAISWKSKPMRNDLQINLGYVIMID